MGQRLTELARLTPSGQLRYQAPKVKVSVDYFKKTRILGLIVD